MLLDTHVHLDQIESVERVIQTDRQAEISAIIAVGMKNASNREVLAARQLNILATIVPNGTFVQNVIYFCIFCTKDCD